MLYLKVKPRDAQKVKEMLKKTRNYENAPTLKEQGYVLFPIKQKIEGYEIVEREVEKNKSSEKLGSYEIIGEIAIIDQKKNMQIAEEILKRHKKVRSVYAKTKRSGRYRVSELLHLAGEDKSETEYKENGFIYVLDVKKVYFSPRLSHERLRICEKIKEGETVLVLFAGVGPFAIPISKKTKTIANELNPIAVEYMRINAEKNRCKLEIHCEDARKTLRKIKADVVIMPLPHEAHSYLEEVAKALNPNGRVYLYTIIDKNKDKEEISEKVDSSKWEITEIRKVNNYSPSKIQICLELRLKNNQKRKNQQQA